MSRHIGVALLISLLGLTACAGPPTIRGVLKDRYPGYDQVLPTATASPNDSSFDYLPGNILALALAAPRNGTESALWNNIGIYCPTNIPLSTLRPVERKSIRVVYDLDLSLRKALALSKLKTTLQLEPNEVEYLKRVTISVDTPRVYAINASANRARYVDACIDAIASRPDLYKLSSVLVGTISIDFTFKENVSFLARAKLLGKINGSLGFGAVKGESYSIVAENVVFGARVRPIKLRRPVAKPMLVSMSSVK